MGERLSEDLKIPFISKDIIKELLFDKIGSPESRDENYAYGRAAMSTIFTLIKEFQASNKPLSVDCAFYANESAADLTTYNIDVDKIMQIYVVAKPDRLMQRFNDRIERGMRHLGHGDVVKSDAAIFNEYIKKYAPLDIPHTISIDTSQLTDSDYSELLEQASKFIKSSV